MAVGLVTLSLRSGPIEVQTFAKFVEHGVNDGQHELRLSVGSAFLALSRRAGEPALRFRDVELRSIEGDLLLAVPRIGARFNLSDLLVGELRVTNLYLRGPEAEIVRRRDGRWQLGLGIGMTITEASGDDAIGDDLQVAEGDRQDLARGFAVATAILDGLAGGDPALPELARLESVTIRDAALTYRNAETGAVWSTEGATLRARRSGDGLAAALGIGLEEDETSPLRTIRVAIRRQRGVAGTDIDLSLHGVRPATLAVGVPEFDWLSLIDAPIDATLTGRLADDGDLGVVSGTIYAGEGRLVGTDGAELASTGFDRLKLDFSYDPSAERLALAELSVAAEAGSASLSGFVDVERTEAGQLHGLVGQLGIGALGIDMAEVFAEPIGFDGGEVVARVGFSPVTVDIASARLDRGALTMGASGRLQQEGGAWLSDIRAEAHNLTIAGLKSHWPLPFARNARTWVVEHLQSGVVDTLVAHARIGHGQPQIALDFSYRDLVSRYLGDMPAIRNAHGRGYLRLHDFVLEMDGGRVAVGSGEDIALDGSWLRISELWAETTPADIHLRGAGPLGGILALIDEKPLGLVSKLGLDSGSISGDAQVETRLSFPLINDLLLEQIDADAKADVVGLVMELPFGRDDPIAITGEAVALTASTTEMTVAGDVLADGIPLNIDWREIYGATPDRREVIARGQVTPGLMTRLDASLPGFESGTADLVVRMSQEGASPPEIVANADLAASRLALPVLGWSKAPGIRGTLEAQVRLLDGGAAEITRIKLDTAGLAAQGSLGISPSGRVDRATMSRVVLDERADLSVEFSRPGDRGLAATLRGRKLDLALIDQALGDGDITAGSASETDAQGEGATALPEIAVEFDLAEVVVTPELSVTSARGRADSSDGGGVTVSLDGKVNDLAPVDAELSLPPDGEGSLRMDVSDAGAFLRATGLSETARDGQLSLSAKVLDSAFTQFSGEVRMSNVTLREASTFEGILNRGGISQTVAGGLAFSKVQIPFEYQAGTITLGTSIATGPALAVKLDGTIEQESRALDLSGVISPAYALTGALDNVPLLGALLSGGKGEGILAMTFTVGGTIDDPSYSVNPLSLLTPGILRRIFTSKAREPDERFLEGLRSPD
ncbi:AsmA-like C-terminal domain-containing protein [Limibaculum sp. M0105]|uniref:AsmA-like C-terminal domain-containing protein n=1 Tax=Thermohalobaculum xanthum TaxID=2753746 RepID=A0A8J7M4C6_9RHOB|nr:AsmA-like C-terminal domain-containing protein [Thermohalobaculum xanthum]MBK0397998.1 AsmA-like C-terminal domain-containing protein [Thermohalobaculum xanthum]